MRFILFLFISLFLFSCESNSPVEYDEPDENIESFNPVDTITQSFIKITDSQKFREREDGFVKGVLKTLNHQQTDEYISFNMRFEGTYRSVTDSFKVELKIPVNTTKETLDDESNPLYGRHINGSGNMTYRSSKPPTIYNTEYFYTVLPDTIIIRKSIDSGFFTMEMDYEIGKGVYGSDRTTSIEFKVKHEF